MADWLISPAFLKYRLEITAFFAGSFGPIFFAGSVFYRREAFHFSGARLIQVDGSSLWYEDPIAIWSGGAAVGGAAGQRRFLVKTGRGAKNIVAKLTAYRQYKIFVNLQLFQIIAGIEEI